MVADRIIIINSKTRIKVLLDADLQRVISTLVQLNPSFSRLRNPMLRNLLAPRVSIADACRITGCAVTEFLKSMALIGFTIDETALRNKAVQPEKDVPQQKIDFKRGTKVTVLDVRPYLEKKQDPLKLILTAVNKLGPGERIKIINTFEPVPLIDLLADRGFLHHTDRIEEKLIATWFEKTGSGDSKIEIPASHRSPNEESLFNEVRDRFSSDKIRYIDVRQLEMPKPMLLIMESLATLKVDELLYVHHKKVPIFLLPELESKGMAFLFNHLEEGAVEMLIYKP